MAVGFYSFVAKADVRNYPIFGYGAWALQGIFVERRRIQKNNNISLIINNKISDSQ